MMRISNTGPHLRNERLNLATEMQTGMHWLRFLLWLFKFILKLQRGCH